MNSGRTFKVSIIIPVLNDTPRLMGCLNALAGQTYDRTAFTVTVVDNGSTPMIPDLSEAFPFVRVVREEKPGSYAARNLGLKSCPPATLIAFTDADCVPAADWIERGSAAIEALGGPGMVGGRIEVTADDSLHPTTAEIYERVFAFPQAEFVRVGFSATANLFTTRETVDLVGAFDERLMSGGDMEWGQRVRAHGLPQQYMDEVCVFHPARRTVLELLRRVVRIAIGNQQLAEYRGEGTLGLRTYAWRQVVLLRRIRNNLGAAGLTGFADRLRFAALVWTVDVVRTVVRYYIHFKHALSRIRDKWLPIRSA